MEVEITEKEREMLVKGIIFSTSKANPLFIKDGMEGGNYVCEAYQGDGYLNLVIYDLDLDTQTQRMKTSGSIIGEEQREIEIEYIRIDSCITGEGERESSHCLPVIFFQCEDNDCMRYDSSHIDSSLKVASDKYSGLSLETQAKRFFIDFLNIIKSQNKSKEQHDTVDDENCDQNGSITLASPV